MQLKWLCNHLGHTGKVHEQYYRQTSGIIERIEIAKLMLMQEHNLVGKFRNKDLSEVDFVGTYINYLYTPPPPPINSRGI